MFTTIAGAAKSVVTHALAALVGLPPAAGFVSMVLIVADMMLLIGFGFIGANAPCGWRCTWMPAPC